MYVPIALSHTSVTYCKCTIHISLATAENTGNTDHTVWYIGVNKHRPYRIGRFSLAALTGKKETRARYMHSRLELADRGQRRLARLPIAFRSIS